jgi:hypothetical protein
MVVCFRFAARLAFAEIIGKLARFDIRFLPQEGDQ